MPFFYKFSKSEGGGLLEECPIPIYPYTYTHSLLLHKLFYNKNLCKMLKGKLHLDLHSAKRIRTSLRYAALLRSLESMIWIIFLLGYFDICGIYLSISKYTFDSKMKFDTSWIDIRYMHAKIMTNFVYLRAIRYIWNLNKTIW